MGDDNNKLFNAVINIYLDQGCVFFQEIFVCFFVFILNVYKFEWRKDCVY